MGEKGDGTKKRIIRAARRMFRGQGYGATSIDDICRESGVTKGNLYFYFDSKQELACVAIDDSTNSYIPFFRILMEDEADPLKRIELMIDGIVGYYSLREHNAN